MTTPPQQNINRGRKRPAPGTSAPILSSIPATSAPPPAASTSVGTDMNFLNLPNNAATANNATSAGSGGNIYSNGPGLAANTADAYRNARNIIERVTSNTQGSELNLPITANENNSQLARINRGTNTLIRMPSYGLGAGGGGIPQTLGMPGQQFNILGGVTGSPIGRAQVGMMGGAQQNDGLESLMLDRELQSKIAEVRKTRSSIPPFVQKLSSFVNDPKTDNLIRWSPSGNSFLVLDEDEFSKTLIPDLFKHNNYASFVRQLNMYGFHKVVGLADGSLKTSEQRSKPPSEYENEFFKRGQPDLMWLITKPRAIRKGKARISRGKGDDESDKDEIISDNGGGDHEYNGGGYLERKHDGEHGGRGSKPDFQTVIQQLESVRSHQALISAAINRLRKDHTQLYEQSVAFQTLHERHENSINAILTFLATVYDKSLGGHINGGAFNNLFAPGQVEHTQGGIHQPSVNSVGPVVGNAKGAIVTNGTQGRQNPGPIRTTQRRRQLLLENGPGSEDLGLGNVSVNASGNGHNDHTNHNHGNNNGQQNGSPIVQNYQNYQNQNIQELFTPNSGPDSPIQQQQQQQTDQHGRQQSQNMFSPIMSLPGSPTVQSSPPAMKNAQSPSMSASSLASRNSFNCNLTSHLMNSSQVIQEHNAQLAAKAREIEELEELQVVQNENVDELMDMMKSFTQSEDFAGNDGNVDANVALQGQVNLDDLINWVPDSYGADLSGPYNTSGAEMHNIPAHSDELDDLLFHGGMDGGGQDTPGMGVNSNISQVLGTNTSTVAGSPTGSVGSRAREEMEEEMEDISPKRRRLG
ncbi:Heat shock transcription factor [Rhizina undulata]